jgi:hypothetical protein
MGRAAWVDCDWLGRVCRPAKDRSQQTHHLQQVTARQSRSLQPSPNSPGVRALAGGRDMLVPLVNGGPGDLEQRARLHDVALLGLLRLDELEHVHRITLATKPVARLSAVALCGNTRFSLRNRAARRAHLWSAHHVGNRRRRPASPTHAQLDRAL